MSSSTLVNDEVVPPPSTQNTRRLAFIIPLSSPPENHSSEATSSTSNSRSVLLLIFMVPSNSSSQTSPLSGLGGGMDFLDFLRRDEDDAYHDLLNRLMMSFQPRGPPPASKSFVEGLPKLSIDIEMQKNAIRCPVCLMDYDLEEEVLQLPCKHVYHSPCITTWLKQANTCCVCRHELPKDEEETTEKSEEQNPSPPQVSEPSENEDNNDDDMPPLIRERENPLYIPRDRSENEMNQIHSDFNSRLRDLLGMPLLEALNMNSFSEPSTNQTFDDEIFSDIQNLFPEINTESPVDETLPTVNISSTNVQQPNVYSPSEQLQTFPSTSRILEDDIPPQAQTKRKGPMNWFKKQLSKFSCLRGIF